MDLCFLIPNSQNPFSGAERTRLPNDFVTGKRQTPKYSSDYLNKLHFFGGVWGAGWAKDYKS